MPPSQLFYAVKRDAMLGDLARTMRGTFRAAPVERTGIYAGNNEIIVSGRRYRFRNTAGLTVYVGKAMPVINVGRLAAAVYAPAESADARSSR